MISVYCQGKQFNIIVIQVYATTINAEEAERFYEDFQDLLQLKPKKDVLFIIEDWNAKVESQKIIGVTGKFGLAVWNETGQRITEFSTEHTGYRNHSLSTTQEKTLHMDITRWSTLKSD